MPKRRKKPYFHNSVEALRQAPDEFFRMEGPALTFEEFMSWKVGGYEIPATVDCIIRERNLVTDKVKEYVYRRAGPAQRKLRERMNEGIFEFTIVRDDAIHFLTPSTEEPYDDPLA